MFALFAQEPPPSARMTATSKGVAREYHTRALRGFTVHVDARLESERAADEAGLTGSPGPGGELYRPGRLLADHGVPRLEVPLEDRGHAVAAHCRIGYQSAGAAALCRNTHPGRGDNQILAHLI